jgi:hypothetical protein
VFSLKKHFLKKSKKPPCPPLFISKEEGGAKEVELFKEV